MAIQHITELFALDGREFVTEAYRNLLSREPDVQGMAYYLGRLAQGRGKDAVIAQLAKSPECKSLEQINGLKQLIEDRRRAQHWFWGRFTIRSRFESTLRSSLFSFERIVEYERILSEQVVQVQRELSAIGDALARLSTLFQAKEASEKYNEEILHNFHVQQEEIEALILERKENRNRLTELEQQKKQLEVESTGLMQAQDALQAEFSALQQERDGLEDLAAQRESELAALYQTKELLEKDNGQILHNFLAQQEEMEVLILERRENRNRLTELEQQKNQLEAERDELMRVQNILHAQRAVLQQERDEQAWYAAERLAWLKEAHIHDV